MKKQYNLTFLARIKAHGNPKDKTYNHTENLVNLNTDFQSEALFELFITKTTI